jgi:hypothetical protein
MQWFDASIDLTVHTVPSDLDPDQAVVRVRAAVEGLAGAGCVSVERCGDAPARLPWLALYEPGNAVPQSGGAFDALAALVESTVRHAIECKDHP